MSIQQISIFLDNADGRLAAVTRLIAQENINLRALSLADSHDFGILRIIVEHPEDAVETLKAAGYTTILTRVLAIEIDDRPGAMAQILTKVAEAGIAVEYTYAFVGAHAGSAYMILRVNDTDATEVVLHRIGCHVVSQEEIFV